MSGVSWRQAWTEALYGAGGFYRREAPAAHFRTSVHASALFAGALLRLACECGLDRIVDLGAGRGELLNQVHRLDDRMALTAVDVAARPEGLPDAIEWRAEPPEPLTGLVVANEWLDNLPCEVVEVGEDGTPHVVCVDSASGAETLGPQPAEADAEWCARWWPLRANEAGTRAEVGRARDEAWAEVLGRLQHGLAVAVDYGHTRETRPAYGSLRGYRRGRQVAVRLDGSCDVTADVAVDSLAAAAGGVPVEQHRALTALGVAGVRPALRMAEHDPGGYLAGLGAATEAAELTAAGGLGDHWWVLTATGGCSLPAWAA